VGTKKDPAVVFHQSNVQKTYFENLGFLNEKRTRIEKMDGNEKQERGREREMG
jgi:hypothetical protein